MTELMARPLLNLHVPALAGFSQPLAGEFAGRRDAASSALPFPAGYGVEIALLIDALRLAGLDALAEARVGTRQNRHQPLRELGAMAYAVLAAVERRIGATAASRPGTTAGPGTTARSARPGQRAPASRHAWRLTPIAAGTAHGAELWGARDDQHVATMPDITEPRLVVILEMPNGAATVRVHPNAQSCQGGVVSSSVQPSAFGPGRRAVATMFFGDPPQPSGTPSGLCRTSAPASC